VCQGYTSRGNSKPQKPKKPKKGNWGKKNKVPTRNFSVSNSGGLGKRKEPAEVPYGLWLKGKQGEKKCKDETKTSVS